MKTFKKIIPTKYIPNGLQNMFYDLGYFLTQTSNQTLTINGT